MGIKTFVFDQILADAFKSGKQKIDTASSMEWFKRRITNYGITQAKLIAEAAPAGRMKQQVVPGRMYFYGYDPKTKADMPFYDAFPLVFIIDFEQNGFTALNLHYIQPGLRVALMRQLFQFASNDTYDRSTKLRLSYAVIKAASGMPFYKACFKRYLYGHVRSKFIEVLPAEWTSAAFLPVADFKKASQQSVWNWSKSQLK